MYDKNQTKEFYHVFDVVEKLHFDGEQYVRRAITLGLLEDIQNIASHNSEMDLKPIIRFFKPETLKRWNLVNDYWTGNINAFDDIDM